MPLLTATTENRSAGDQARVLRTLVAERAAARRPVTEPPLRTCRSLVVVGGKGGVGKSVIALNLAMSLMRQEAVDGERASVGLVDVSPGAGSLGLLCGQNGYWNFEHVAAGTRTLDDIVLTGPGETRIIPGVGHWLAASDIRPSVRQALAEFEQRQDWLIVDTGADLSNSHWFAAPADCTLIVTTPEPTSVAEAYAAIKTLAANGVSTVSVVVNQADSEHQALQVFDRLRHAARAFLASDIGLAGFIPFDAVVAQSVFRRVPLADVDRDSPAQQALERIGQRLSRTVSRRLKPDYMETLGSKLEQRNR